MTAAFIATTTALKRSSLQLAALPSFPFLLADSNTASTVVDIVTSATPTTLTTTATTTPAVVFEPIAPDSLALAGFGSIVVLCAVAAYVWANQVVPVSRTKLALSKRNGPVRKYLEELQRINDTENSDDAITAVAMNATTAILIDGAQVEPSSEMGSSSSSSENNGDRALERWLFTDWLEQQEQKSTSSSSAKGAGRQKEPALPILKDAKWNSGDNPVLAATGLILLGVLGSVVMERIIATASTAAGL